MLRQIIFTSVAVALTHCACYIEENEENIVASNLPGTWDFDYELSVLLGPKTYEDFGISQVTFFKNESSLESISGDFCEEFEKVPFYLTGNALVTTFENDTLEYDYGLTIHNGNPYLVYRIPGEKIEGSNCMMASGDEVNLMFIGGEEKPMTAYAKQ